MPKRSCRISRLTKVSTCLMIFLTLCIIMFPVYVLGQPTDERQPPSFYGWVVDEYNQGMENVDIKVYSSDGSYVMSESTNVQANGYFDIFLAPGNYILHFSKEGYVKVTKSVSFRYDSVNLGDIVLLKALRLSASTLSLIASQGDKISIPFTEGNIGEEAEVVEFLISKPEDWSVRILYQSLEVTKVYVSPGQSLMLQLEVTVPLTALVNVDYKVSLTAIGTTSSSLTFTVLVRSQPTQPTVTVSGRIIDEYDNGMKEVEIKVYSSDGAFIKSASTYIDGSFTIELPISTTISLYFSKEGCVKATKSVLLKDEKVELGEIVLLKAVRLYSSVLGLVASPGDRPLLPFVLSNIGEESEIVEFLTSNSEGWSARILDQVGREIRNVELSSKASLNFQLEVTVPLMSAGDNNLTLTAVGRANSALSLTIKVQPLSKSMIFCQFPGMSAAPGDTVRFQVRLKNPFVAEMRFKILVDSIPPNWTASIKSAGGEYVAEVTLGSNEFVDLLVEVKSPDTAKPGKEYGLLVRVESNDGNIMSPLPLNIFLSEVKKEVKINITTKFPEITVEAGKVVQYPITIVNLGDADTLLLLSAEPPAEWKVAFKSGVLEVSKLYLEAGRSENLVIEATPPSTVNVGTYIIPVQVKSENDAIYAETKLKATIVGSYAIKIEPSTLLTSVTAGGSTTFTAKITNTGQTSATGISLDIEAPQGWEPSITPTAMELLKQRESLTFTVAVKTPGDTVAGDYLITLRGLSDQVKSDSVQVRVTVTTPTSWGLIGVGIAAVMVIALAFVFIKFKRR